MAEPWPVIQPFHEGCSWAVDDGGECWTAFSTEAAARRYAALPLLIEAVRHASEFGNRGCLYCGEQPQKHWRRCQGIAALRAAGVEP